MKNMRDVLSTPGRIKGLSSGEYDTFLPLRCKGCQRNLNGRGGCEYVWINLQTPLCTKCAERRG